MIGSAGSSTTATQTSGTAACTSTSTSIVVRRTTFVGVVECRGLKFRNQFLTQKLQNAALARSHGLSLGGARRVRAD